MLIPRRVKHRKQHHPKRSGKAKAEQLLHSAISVFRQLKVVMSLTARLKQLVLR